MRNLNIDELGLIQNCFLFIIVFPYTVPPAAFKIVRRKWVYGRAKEEIWSTSRYAAAIKLDSTTKNAHVPKGTWVLDQDRDEYFSKDNPKAVGPYCG